MQMSFDFWLVCLYADADANGFRKKIENMSDQVLFRFYEEGVEPTIRGLLEIPADATRKAPQSSHSNQNMRSNHEPKRIAG